MHCVVLGRGKLGTGKSWLINNDRLNVYAIGSGSHYAAVFN